jgi:hypothetical protein
MPDQDNILKVIVKHIERVLPAKWWRGLKDYRFSANQQWNFGYIMEVLLAGALSGQKTLRDVETLSELYSQRIPDTTLHDFMVRLDPKGLNKLLAQGVKQALREHELPKSEFPVRITAIDGKGLFNTDRPVNDSSEPITGGGKGEMFRHMVLRAVYVSSETKLYLGQHAIKAKGAETIEFIPFIDELEALYGQTDLLQVISIDAGMVSKANATKVVTRGLKYIMALKDNQPMLSTLALDLLSQCQSVLVEEESYNGKDVSRTLYRIAAPVLPGWEHLREFWKIHTRMTDLQSGKVSEDVRCFMTNLPPAILDSRQVLEAIRMHWGIENDANWCFDVNWQEDTAPWASRAFELVCYLRMLAYNIISRLKTRRVKAPRHRALRWRDFFMFFQQALFNARWQAFTLGTATPAFLR